MAVDSAIACLVLGHLRPKDVTGLPIHTAIITMTTSRSNLNVQKLLHLQPLHGARNSPRSTSWPYPPISVEGVKNLSHVVPLPAAGARLLSYLSPFQADVPPLYWHHGVCSSEDPDA